MGWSYRSIGRGRIGTQTIYRTYLRQFRSNSLSRIPETLQGHVFFVTYESHLASLSYTSIKTLHSVVRINADKM